MRFLISPLQCDRKPSTTFFLHKQQVINQRYGSRSYLTYLNEALFSVARVQKQADFFLSRANFVLSVNRKNSGQSLNAFNLQL